MTDHARLLGRGMHEHVRGHGDGEGHFDHDDDLVALEDNPIWQQENVTLHSVGIDIGSSGTQVVFSKLHLQRNGAGLATRYVVVERTRLFQSVVAFTPFSDADGLFIDAPALGVMIDEAYGAAGIEPDSIDTGVVILTGEALRRENAKAIAMVVAEKAGDFVCATAGHHMEAALAAYGSGAVQLSEETGQRLLNIDIGGGTTKLSLVDSGRIVQTAAIHVGGRLLVVDDEGEIVRLEDAARVHGRSAGMDLRLGQLVSPAELDQLADVMAGVLAEAVTADRATSALPYLTDPIDELCGIEGVVFSGGVGEYVYGEEDRDFHDLGRRLGRSIRHRLDDGSIPFPLLPAAARIRATALGASEFSVQLSGNTCFVAPEVVLPRRNLQVVRPELDLAHQIDVHAVAQAIHRHLATFDLAERDDDVVVALAWSGEVSYTRLHALGAAIVDALGDRITAGHPVLLALDADIARSLGNMLREEFGVTGGVVVIDGLNLLDFDYVDIGTVLEPSHVIPVTIKSLLF